MRKRLLSVLLTIGLVSGLLASFSPAIEANHLAREFVVNSTGDDVNFNAGDGFCETAAGNGICTLRAAIEEANADATAAHITFDITGAGPHTITLGSDLPTIETRVDIDGTTEDACDFDHCVEVNGNGNHIFVLEDTAAPGNPSGSVIQALVMNRSSTNGVEIHAGVSNVTITNNFIGTNVAGDAAGPGNDHGVDVRGADNTVTGNVISGNVRGVVITFASGNGNLVQNNLIGTSAEGTTGVPNFQGMLLQAGADDNTVVDNVISRNTSTSIFLAQASNNTIARNLIGTAADGTSNLGNNGDGISLTNGSADNTIGGALGQGNTIAFNGSNGINIRFGDTTVGNEIARNSIFNNGGLGIDLNNDGVTLNDAGDADVGPNNLQNFPVLDDPAELSAAGTRVTGTLNSEADKIHRIEFFSNVVCNPNTAGFPQADSNGEGRTFLEAITVNTDGAGNASFDEIIATPPSGERVLTSTATRTHLGDPRDTSEFSECVAIEDIDANLEVEKTGPATAAPGDTINYFIDVSNIGAAVATDVTLEDDAPAELTNTIVVDRGAFASCTVLDSEGTSAVDVVCDGGTDFAPGASTQVHLRATIEDGTPDGTVIVNEARASTPSPEIDPTNNVGAAETEIQDVPVVAVDKTADKPAVNPGDDLRYTIEVENTGGTHDVEDLALADNMDPNTTFEAFVDTGLFTCVLIDPTGASDPDFTCDGGVTLAPGESTEVIFDVTVDPATPFGTITNEARVTSSNAPAASDTQETTVGGADLAVTKTGPATASEGDQVDFFVDVTNHGPEGVAEAKVVDDFDADFEDIQIIDSGGFACVVNDPDGTDAADEDVVCDGAGLTAGQTRTIHLQARVEDGASFPVLNAVEVQTVTGPGDPDLSNNTDQIQVDEEPPPALCPGFEHLTDHIHIVGTPGEDLLVATTGDPHVICGLAGDDHIEGGPANDVLDGGPGDDTMFGRAGNDRMFGRSGNDIMRGGSGNDVIRGGSGDNFIFGGDGNDRLFGGTGNDVIRGGPGDDDIDTGPGNNIVRAGPGDDHVIGGDGINRLHGGPGNDYLEANGDAGTAANPNVLRGAGGDDRLVGAPGPNSFTNFHCGPGNDEVVLRGGTNNVHQSC